MAEIKVGSWVRVGKRKTLTKVTRIFGLSPRYYVDQSFSEDVESWYTISSEQIELWEPKLNEWCWFYKEGLPVLGRYVGAVDHSNLVVEAACIVPNGSGKDTHDVWAYFERCEPFFGLLPKELHDRSPLSELYKPYEW